MSSSEEELFQSARRELFSAVIGDVMDKMGLQHQFLPPAIVPLDRQMIVCGRAMTVLEADVFDEVVEGSHNALSAKPFGLMMEALDSLQTNEVYLCTGSSPRYALWGELMSVRATKCGAAGAVVDGYSRDTRGVLALGFPTFSYGSYAQDQGPRGKVIDYRIPIQVGQVRVSPGDIVFGDLDGVCVVPRAAEEEVLNRAFEKARKEKVVRKALEEGMPAKDAFAKYGIL
ncbi:MAG: RraA family protein [Acidobacteriota bacterium]|nr:RraA family protein [Acidobacteriota bacterium]